jgi:hypothetical protein
MKTKPIIIIALLSFFSLQLFAQNALVGTWEYKNDSVRSVKIITPTHWMVFSESLKEKDMEFIRAHGGTYTITGNKYVENIETASWEDFSKTKTDFTYEVDGDKFFQKGLLTFEDGSVIHINEVWQKVKTPNSYDNNPSVGVWDQLSSTYTMADGSKETHTNPTVTRFQIITPTHWMRISHRNNKFRNFMGGTYNTYGNKLYPNFEFISNPSEQYRDVVIDQKVDGDKLSWNGYVTIPNGETLAFEDVFQQVVPNENLIKTSLKK